MLFSRRLLVSLAVLTMTSLAAAQAGTGGGVGTGAAGGPAVPAPGSTFRYVDGGASGMMQSIFVSPKAHAPFSLMLSAEWSKPASDGGSFTMVNERRIIRDSNGRIYQERRGLVPKGSEMKSPLTVFQITDPQQHTWYNCVPQTKVCDLYFYRRSTAENFEPSLRPTGPLPQGRGFIQSEDLGLSTTQGVETHGYREVTTWNPGAMGNDKEMKATREFWYSPQLALNLISIVDQPWSGKQVFRVTELSTSEPDASYFEVPAEYKVVDQRTERPADQ